METGKVKVEGSSVTVDAGSSKAAREIGAKAQSDLLVQKGGLAGFTHKVWDGMDDVVDAVGRKTFEGIAIVLMVVGAVIAYISWSRLLPIKAGMAVLVGVVGVMIVIALKASASRWAVAQNVVEDAREDKDALREAKALQRRQRYQTIAAICLVLDSLAALGFSAAVAGDAETGVIDYQKQIGVLEREARELGWAADEMPRKPEALEILQEDLNRLLIQDAKRRDGQSAKMQVATAIGWGNETYCMGGTEYQFYVDKYCPDVIELHRDVRNKQLYLAKVAEKNARLAEAKALREARPETSSAMALGDNLKGFWSYAPSVAFMALILLTMTYSAYVSKRDPKGMVV